MAKLLILQKIRENFSYSKSITCRRIYLWKGVSGPLEDISLECMIWDVLISRNQNNGRTNYFLLTRFSSSTEVTFILLQLISNINCLNARIKTVKELLKLLEKSFFL